MPLVKVIWSLGKSPNCEFKENIGRMHLLHNKQLYVTMNCVQFSHARHHLMSLIDFLLRLIIFSIKTQYDVNKIIIMRREIINNYYRVVGFIII